VITDVAGIRVGHWTDTGARTGCTVVLFDEGTVASGEVRGGAPATRETALLDPTRMVQHIDALLLTGGSAFGLSAADGVVRWCEERGRGFATAAGPVPIVVALGLYDLAVGDASVRPGPAEGRAACDAASAGPVPDGPVGAGTGATVDKVLGPDARRPGGLVQASTRLDGVTVAALVAVNAFGEIGGDQAAHAGSSVSGSGHPFGNTTIGLVATDARVDKVGCHLLAQAAHDGLARAVVPSHTRVDGDAFVAAATGAVTPEPDAPEPDPDGPSGDPDLDQLRAAAAAVTTRAILELARA
jgi:L-aminopeptidase/D-esterase-like protein